MTKKLRDGAAERLACVLYARVSTTEQKDEGYSLDAQLDLLRDYAARHGLIVRTEFIDAESGSSAGRTQFGQMLEFVKEHPHTAIIVEKADRLSRNFADIVRVDELVEEYGCRLHFVKDGVVIDRDSRSGDKLTYGIKVVLAKHFSDNLREEVRKGMNEKAKQGVFPSCAPIGFLNVTRQGRRMIEPDPDRAPLIRRIFEAYAARQVSITTAAAFAKEIGLTSRKGKSFARASIGRMLENPTYAGFVAWNGQVFPGQHEPIISLALFDQVQAVMRGKKANNGESQHHEFVYRGLMKCAYCGCTITVEQKKGRFTYYHCSGSKNAKCPGKKAVREEALTEQFAALLDDLVLTDSTLDWLRNELREDLGEERAFMESQLADWQAKEKALRTQLEQLYLDKLSGEVPVSIYGTLKERLERELAEAELRQRALKVAEGKYYEKAEAVLELAQTAALRFKVADSATRRAMLIEMQSNCILEDGKIQVQLQEPFDTLLKTNVEAKKKGLEDGPFEIWYSGRDSNPRSSP